MTPFSVARLRHSSARAPRRAALRGGAVAGAQSVRDSIEQDFPRPVPPPRTKWTRLVPHPVLIGHAAQAFYGGRAQLVFPKARLDVINKARAPPWKTLGPDETIHSNDQNAYQV